MSGSAETFFGGYEQKYTSKWRAINYIFLSICRENDTHELTAGSWDVYSFFEPAGVASTSPKYELGKVAFSSMFLKRKKSQLFGTSSFAIEFFCVLACINMKYHFK